MEVILLGLGQGYLVLQGLYLSQGGGEPSQGAGGLGQELCLGPCYVTGGSLRRVLGLGSDTRGRAIGNLLFSFFQALPKELVS